MTSRFLVATELIVEELLIPFMCRNAVSRAKTVNSINS